MSDTISNDLISRQAAIDAYGDWYVEEGPAEGFIGTVKQLLEGLQSAQSEHKMDEWCTNCKEYDQERHCCPRWNRVIRQTVEEYKAAQPSFSCGQDNDLISRKAAIDAFGDVHPLDYNTQAHLDKIKALPSAQPVARDINVLSNDLISRQAAIDATIDAMDLWFDNYNRGRDEAIEKAIGKLPPAQPEIIRCKDCVYYHPNYCEIWSKYGTVQTRENGFCYMAERRTDD